MADLFELKPELLRLKGSKPKVQFEGQEAGAGNISIQEDGGEIKVVDESASAVLTTLTKLRKNVSVVRIPQCGAAGDTWERAILYACQDLEVVEAGIVPDSSFGQANDYATLKVVNKGTDGSGNTELCSKAFDSAVNAYVFTSFGTISNGSVSEGEVLALKKEVTGNGQQVPTSAIVLVVKV